MTNRALNALMAWVRRFRRSGAVGERIAGWHLESKGYQIIARNYRCRLGEVDLVARKAGFTVFVEVKERRTTSHGDALEAVTRTKRRRIIQAARMFAAAHGLSESAMRFDVIAIEWARVDRRPRVLHAENAFDERGL